jgi:hypothetical protein
LKTISNILKGKIRKIGFKLMSKKIGVEIRQLTVELDLIGGWE